MSAGSDNAEGPWLLVSDIDDTLTGDAKALATLVERVAANRDRLRVAVNSSRPSGSVARTLANEFPPGFAPDAVITALGTEITVGGAHLQLWEERFADWPAERVHRILSGLGHIPHAPEFQTRFKVSYAVPAAERAAAGEALSSAGIDCRIIASGTDDFDILPPLAGKGAATRELAAELGIPPDRLVVAGDSGNDLAMFAAARNRIAVGNARPELIQALEPGSFYHAGRSHAGGVLEGLVHFGALPEQ